ENLDNRKLADYLLQYENYAEVNPLIKHGIEGNCYIGNPTHPVSPRVMFRALQCLPELNFEAVKSFVNRTEAAVTGKQFGDRHAYYMFQRLKSAKKSVEFLYRNVLDNYEIDTNLYVSNESSPE
ncbi:MAG: hypothetical protein ACRDC4_09330, partial [Plesiomonas sp.]